MIGQFAGARRVARFELIENLKRIGFKLYYWITRQIDCFNSYVGKSQ